MKYYPGAFGGNVAIETLKKQAPVTLTIIAINLGIFVISFIFNLQQDLIILGAMPPIEYVLATGEYWRFLTSFFIHSGLMHVVFNMIILLHAGGYLEPHLGSRHFSFFYMISGLLVSFFSGVFTNALSVGASGAIFALLGFLLFFELLARKRGIRTNNLIVPLVAINIIITIIIPQISFVAHLSGLIIGYIYASYRYKIAANNK